MTITSIDGIQSEVQDNGYKGSILFAVNNGYDGTWDRNACMGFDTCQFGRHDFECPKFEDNTAHGEDGYGNY